MMNQDRTILFAPKIVGEESAFNPCDEASVIRIYSLPDPRTFHPKPYILFRQSRVLMEIQTMEMPFRSWSVDDLFIGGTRKTMITTPVHPVYILLAILERADGTRKNQFTSVEDLLHHDEFPSLQELRICSLEKNLGLLCDTNEIGGETYYRLNKEKATSWIETRVQRLFLKFDSLKIFNRDKPIKTFSDAEKYRHVFSILDEYISDEWLSPLEAKFIPQKEQNQLPEAASVDSTMYFDDKLSKRPMPEADGGPPQKVQKKKVITKKPAAPPPSRTKPLTAFFAPKKS